ncbi:hypothetical protein [Pseudovibrio brasiliensis]|uniref:hypothetical protein n=1 Tax=Pseudovibrio brasiliensis TaxID=1898042 RepID=UPI0018D20C50|nr:hypothetical protein [Pseudovibrio brasiliensis]
MTEERDDYIAGSLRTQDWQIRKRKLEEGATAELWADTFDEFLLTRLDTRYLKPIRILQANGCFEGEGFAIVSVQCALLEFLAALKIGKNYRYVRNRADLEAYEYNGSKVLFRDFLMTEEPFKDWFTSDEEAESFYANVRCALLHEARTKDGWRIWATGSPAVDPKNKIVRRNSLYEAIDQYLVSYGQLLTEDKRSQEAFIRKFDHLADY